MLDGDRCRSDVGRALQDLMDANYALWRDRILVRKLTESIRARNLDQLFLLQHHQRPVDDVVEGKADVVRNALSSDLVVEVDELEHQISNARQVEASLLNGLR